MTLFDPKEYQKPGTVARGDRTVRAKSAPEDTYPVRTSSVWRIVHANTPGVVHAVKSGPNNFGAFKTHCGVEAGARTFGPDETVHGCGKCFELIERARLIAQRRSGRR